MSSPYGNERSKALTPLSDLARLHILEKATEKMKNENKVDPDLNLVNIVAMTRSYSGPELELLVRVAQGGALSSQLLRNSGVPTTEGLKLTMGDFTSAMDVIKPDMESLKEDLKKSSSIP